jgi:glycosyltransferase involved in cell wall biosynthesis
VLVIGGTRQLAGLRKARARGVPVVQRLDGMNWLHRRTRTGWRHWARAQIGNRLLTTIRNRVATRVVYQSAFVRDWWQREHGPGPASTIVHNGVDLQRFKPGGGKLSSTIKILMVEGNLMGGYEMGLQTGVDLVEKLKRDHSIDAELHVAGIVTAQQKQRWAAANIAWHGIVPNEEVPALNNSAHLLYSADINAACPNSVIEALACGLPVLAFDTGAIKELVPHNAGRVVPYGGDPWKLDPPDIAALARGAADILQDRAALSQGARAHAEAALGLDKMVDAYIEALSG